MAYVKSIDGPSNSGAYQAHMSDGTVVTFGVCTDPRYRDENHPENVWFVSVPDGHDHTTFIVETHGSFEGQGPWMIRKVKETGSDKGAWRLYATAILNS